jgi:hypothetical protein
VDKLVMALMDVKFEPGDPKLFLAEALLNLLVGRNQYSDNPEEVKFHARECTKLALHLLDDELGI